MSKKFILQCEGKLVDDFADHSEYDTYDEAEEAAVKLFDNGSGHPGDFRIVEAETGHKWRLLGYRLMTEDCPVCGKPCIQSRMVRTYDCHGIPYRRVCDLCYDKVMAKGYDGERYGPLDECLDYDY